MPVLVNSMVVDLPPLRLRQGSLFVDVASDISSQFKDGNADRTARGATWLSLGALAPIVKAYWCNIDDDKSTANLTTTQNSNAGALQYNHLTCSAIGVDGPWLSDLVDGTVRDLASHALAFMATTQMLPPGHINFLENGTNVGAGATIIDALERVEEGLAERASNYQGQISVPIRRLAELTSLGVLYREAGGRVYSPAGHEVIIDAGHQGDNTIFGTTQLGYSIQSSVELNDYVTVLNRVHNDIRWMAETYLAVVFNPNHTVYSTVTGSSL